MSSDKSETRQRILAATLELLENEPASGARMADIAKRAGVSRQAVYLHFGNRAELLIQTTVYVDEKLGSDERLVASRTAKDGSARLQAFVSGWAAYIPEIYPVGRALMSLRETDEAAGEAWDKRMRDMREGCAAAIEALERDGMLEASWGTEDATDILWGLLSLRNWEHWTGQCGWSQERYADHLLAITQKLFLVRGA